MRTSCEGASASNTGTPIEADLCGVRVLKGTSGMVTLMGSSGISRLSGPRFQDGEVAHRVAAVLAFLFHHDAQAPPDRAGLIGIARRG
jgi:hypothetical protein